MHLYATGSARFNSFIHTTSTPLGSMSSPYDSYSHKALFLFTPFKPSRITSRLKFTFHIIPCNTMLSHAKSSHVIPCHIMLSHVMSLRGSHFPTLPDQHLDLI